MSFAGREFYTYSVILRVFVIFSLLSLYMAGAAHALTIETIPRALDQGGPFVVKVTGVKGRKPISGLWDSRPLRFTGCGSGCYMAVAAAGLYENPGIHRIEVSQGKTVEYKSVVVHKGKFPLQRLTVDKSRVELSPEDQARAEREEDMLINLWSEVNPPAWSGRFASPLENEITTGFGVRRIYNKKLKGVHRGLDIAGSMGEPIRAANSGRVKLAEELFYGGMTIVLDHGLGIHTVYMHMSKFAVSPGQTVAKGDVIGFVGSTGRSTGPHLHYGAKVGIMSVDPGAMPALPLEIVPPQAR